MVLDTVTGKDLETLARENIFDPLDMSYTSYVWQNKFDSIYCHGHTIEQQPLPKDIETEPGAAGSMETTLIDYSKFVNHILHEYESESEAVRLMFDSQIRIHSKRQFGPLSWEDSDENDDIQLRYGLGWGLLSTPHGIAAFKEGHGEGFQHYSILFPETGTAIVIMTNGDNGESIFKYLLEYSIGDIYTPWTWENYIPYDI